MNSNTERKEYALFLDDVRKPIGGGLYDDGIPWVIVRSYDAFCKHIEENGLPVFCTFDHDLAFEHYPFNEVDGGVSNPNTIPYDTYKEKTGYHCAQWLIEYCNKHSLMLPTCRVHSMNPVGRKNIEQLLERFEELQSE